MINILAFDSLYIINPLRMVYLSLVKKLLNKKVGTKNKLVLYRLDKDNVFIRDKRNLSGTPIGIHVDNIDALSIKFYRYLQKTKNYNSIKIKNHQLLNLYTRQVKLKLGGLLKCAYRIKKLSNNRKSNLEIITDKQTISIMKEVYSFLNFSSNKIKWKSNSKLTACLTINSIIMRAASIINMLFKPTNLPKEYFYRHVSSDAYSILTTMPKRKPEQFFKSYVRKLSNKFNIIIYSAGFLDVTPKGYERRKIKRKIGLLYGIFNLRHLSCDLNNYITDILLIYKNHPNLSMSIDIVNSLYDNKIDAHISRLQTDVLNNLLAREAQKKQIFVLGDIMEEIFYCDAAICSSESEFSESVKLALNNNNKIVFKESNSLIKYRLLNFSIKKKRYLHKLLGINLNKKIIFYASDPSKEQSQRYLTEKFLFKYFLSKSDFIFVIKTHSQDDGKITNYAYEDAGKPSNTILIGDVTQKTKIVSNRFKIFDKFDFNSAIATSNGFLTSSSSSILQALAIGTKSAVVDIFNNGFYKNLIKYKAAILINNEKSLDYFLQSSQLKINGSTLRYCGLKNKEEFNLKDHLLKNLNQYYKNR